MFRVCNMGISKNSRLSSWDTRELFVQDSITRDWYLGQMENKIISAGFIVTGDYY
jgi:hypothetical protein